MKRLQELARPVGNQIINPIVLPEVFATGDTFVTQDVRIAKRIGIANGVELSLIGELFNLLNIANLTGYSGVLNQPNYGQPSARMGQVFGTRGRARANSRHG